MVRITCTGTDELALTELREFQGELKSRTDEQKKRLKDSLEKYGFSFPFFVWKEGQTNWVLDGHGRLETLTDLGATGKFPVVYVEAGDVGEAKRKLLQLNSRYGDITTEGLSEFVSDLEDLDLTEFGLEEHVLELPELIEAPKSASEMGEVYVKAMPAPIYEPSGDEDYSADELYDETKYRDLVQEIQSHKDLPEGVQAFLIAAAARHTVFHYDRIAEYYARATVTEKQLFERSALVLIDYDQALEGGYVRIRSELAALRYNDDNEE